MREVRYIVGRLTGSPHFPYEYVAAWNHNYWDSRLSEAEKFSLQQACALRWKREGSFVASEGEMQVALDDLTNLYRTKKASV